VPRKGTAYGPKRVGCYTRNQSMKIPPIPECVRCARPDPCQRTGLCPVCAATLARWAAQAARVNCVENPPAIRVATANGLG
jgi:hypothetical protein